MENQPTYEELAGRVRDLENQVRKIHEMAEQAATEDVEKNPSAGDGTQERPFRAAAELVNANEMLIEEVKQRLQMEQELIQADKMISLGVLVSGMAHEINNPNNFIMINAQLLSDAWQSIVPILEEQYESQGDFQVAGLPYSEMKKEVPHLLHGIAEGSRRIQRIVKDLREYSRRDAANLEDQVFINDVVGQAIKLLDPLIRKATSHFSVKYGDSIPVIQGSHQKLEQVMINLIQNACQSLEDSGKSVRVTTDYNQENGDILVSVSDEGSGIADDALAYIMDPFFTTKRDTGGTGLGLAVSSNIVKEHKGKMAVQSAPGQGSTFTVCLPTREQRVLKKILVVDDDKLIRDMIARALSSFGDYRIKQVSTGTEASVRLGIEKPDLVVLDMQMPDMNGVEICRLIKTSPELAGIKVIIITGFPESKKVMEAADLGYHYVLAKPFHIKEFQALLDHVLKDE